MLMGTKQNFSPDIVGYFLLNLVKEKNNEFLTLLPFPPYGPEIPMLTILQLL